MTDRGILFSAPMVRALLDGRKTQTRRPVKFHKTAHVCACEHPRWREKDGWYCGTCGSGVRFDGAAMRCPYGAPGDLLWVRETWGVGTRPCPSLGWRDGIEYRADCVGEEAPPLHDIIPGDVEADSIRAGWRPSIHMPRWASRITLRITDVRVERLNEISEADALAEGIAASVGPGVTLYATPGLLGPGMGRTAASAYRLLWEHINGPGSWDANPWVWVVAFERVTL